jgi:hypothetical protein
MLFLVHSPQGVFLNIAPSSSNRPKPVTKIPIAGKVLVPDMGIIMEIDIRAIAMPIVILREL